MKKSILSDQAFCSDELKQNTKVKVTFSFHLTTLKKTDKTTAQPATSTQFST